MISTKLSSVFRTHWMYFSLALALTVLAYTLYGVNIIKWRNNPDFGWRTNYNYGPNIVAEVFAAGEAAGLRVGDTIQAINGQTYSTFDELFFKIRYDQPGSVNTYTVIRHGAPVQLNITTGRLGFETVLWRSGPFYIIGFVYLLIGTLVFLMKPQARESWLFLAMTLFMGVTVSYSSPTDLMRPQWLYELRRLSEVFLPASLVHLALQFPKRRTVTQKRPWLLAVPYALSLILFAAIKMTSTAYWSTPPLLELLHLVYLTLAILLFLFSMVWNFVRDTSITIQLQSQAIFVGIVLGFFIPIAELLFRSLWNVYLFPDPTLGFTVFLITFPLSIGYTIVKHDLFAIDTIVRRTYGYVLSTATIIGVYALAVSVLNVTFQSAEISRSPLFSIIFALGVVLVFEPLHRRFQSFVDRVFYRQHYDYRRTIRDISETMINILDPAEIQRTLIGSVVKEMFLENGVLLLPDPDGHGYHVHVTEGVEEGALASRHLSEEDGLLRAIQEKNEAIFRYEIDLNPAYEDRRETLQNRFVSLASELMLPLKYKNEMRGIISLGRKKSGKMFTTEDLDLLTTMINQSAIALENAKLFEENIEKSRMEEELKIAHDIQTSMLPDKAPKISGVTIAAHSISAREVGGDFYDFIEINTNGKDKQLAIVVGDVSGKAVSGALVMAASRSVFRVLGESHSSVQEIMSIGNVRLNRDIKKGMFVALVYAVLDPQHKTLRLANAGQTAPIICPRNQSAPVYIETKGDRFPLGIVRKARYEETLMALTPGDTLVFYTDGVVEAMNAQEELYGFERFIASIESGRGLDANALLEKLIDDVAHYVGDAEPHDDLTIVVAQVE